MQDIIFANGKRTYDGGAVYGYSTSINCTFEDNSARDGGAIYLGDAVNCTFIGNSACDGGAIYEGGAVNCIFIDNYAHEEGGAILSYAGSFVNCTFINNSAEIGGAILSYEGSVLNCTFTGNYAEYGGGAIYGGANASNCIFTGNSAVYGGALHEGNACNCTFIGNYAENYGGAIYGGSAKACIFNENTAGVGGDNTYRTNMSKPVLSVSDFTSSYKSGEKLIVNLTVDEIPISNANVTIRVYKNNALVGTYYCLSGDGWVVNLDVGDYIADLSVENQEWDADSVNTTLKINKADTYINASDVPIVYTEDGELVACLINDAAGIGIGGANLRFAVGDEKYTVKTNLEGPAKLDISNLTPGTYTATVSYYGNVKYNPSNTTVIIVVNKVTTSISLYYDNATGELVVNLINAETGNGITGANLVFTINGVKTTVKTKYAQARLSIGDADPNNFNASISYGGNSKYLKSTASIKIVEGRIPTVISNAYDRQTQEIVATLTNNQTGQAIKGANVVFTINGVKTTIKTDKLGQVKISVADLDIGTWSISSSYGGNSKYAKSTASINIVKI